MPEVLTETTNVSTRIGFVQVGPEGICFAHGPYLNQCPQWPACSEAPKLRKWIDLSKRPVAEWFSDAEAERTRLEREVIEAGKKWLAELRRINATTYTDEQRAMKILESPAMLLPPITALDDFESSQQRIKK